MARITARRVLSNVVRNEGRIAALCNSCWKASAPAHAPNLHVGHAEDGQQGKQDREVIIGQLLSDAASV